MTLLPSGTEHEACEAALQQARDERDHALEARDASFEWQNRARTQLAEAEATIERLTREVEVQSKSADYHQAMRVEAYATTERLRAALRVHGHREEDCSCLLLTEEGKT